MNSQLVCKSSPFQRSLITLRWAGVAAVASALIAFTPGATLAQSTQRDTPTVLTSNVLVGRGLYQQTQTYFYSFTAGPGELVLTLDADAGTTNGNGVVPAISLQDQDGNQIADVSTYATPGAPARSVKRVSLSTVTPVVLVVTLPAGTTADYTYRLQLSGALQIAKPSDSSH
ncbi:MAG TPA: hypothetical protein V6C57_24225 [Coleofasciculaceae cyanobacterium]